MVGRAGAMRWVSLVLPAWAFLLTLLLRLHLHFLFLLLLLRARRFRGMSLIKGLPGRILCRGCLAPRRCHHAKSGKNMRSVAILFFDPGVFTVKLVGPGLHLIELYAENQAMKSHSIIAHGVPETDK